VAAEHCVDLCCPQVRTDQDERGVPLLEPIDTAYLPFGSADLRNSPPRPSPVPASGQDGSDQPQHREQETDQAKDPMTLAEGENADRKNQHQVDGTEQDTKPSPGHNLISIPAKRDRSGST
jgi:hypothetical protein